MAWSTLHDSKLTPGNRLNINISSYQYRIPIIKIRRSGDRLIFIMEITIPGKTVFILRRGPLPWPISTLRWRHNGRDGVSNHQPAIVYSTVYSDADQGKHQSSVSLAFVRGHHRGPVQSPHKWPVTRKMFPFDDVIMKSQEICIRFPLCYVLLGLGTKVSKEVMDKIFRIILPFFPLSHYFCHTLCGINKNVGFRVDCIKEFPHGKTIIVCQVIPWMNAFRALNKKKYSGCYGDSFLSINTLRPIQSYRNFAGDTCKSISLIENLWIFNKFSLKYTPYGPIDNMATLI